MASCTRCGGETKYNYRLCWRCHVDERVENARQAGYHEGYWAGLTAGRREKTETGSALPLSRVRQLIQLCHPDRHGGSPTSVEVTQWLLGLRLTS